jgi:flagellar protein FliO/FliZ
MGGLRFRWAVIGKAGGACLLAMIAVLVLPGLLQPPAPPPLEPDVGLPREAVSAPGRPARPRLEARRRARSRFEAAIGQARRPASMPGRAAPEPRRSPRPSAVEPAPAPPAASPPPPPPAPAVATAPAPAPPPAPGDGSEEFAPH